MPFPFEMPIVQYAGKVLLCLFRASFFYLFCLLSPQGENMAGKRIGSNEHPPGVREKRVTLHTAILQGVAVLFYSTPFVLTHYIPLKLGKYFSSYALTARWVHFLFVEKWRPLLSVRYVRSLHCRDPPLRNLVRIQISEDGVNHHVL